MCISILGGIEYMLIRLSAYVWRTTPEVLIYANLFLVSPNPNSDFSLLEYPGDLEA